MFSLQNQSLLVIAPHPDDEVLGCAGLIKRIKDVGGKVYVLFLTVGETNDYSKAGLSTAVERIKEIEQVAKLLQYDDYRIAFSGNKYHLQLDTVPQKVLMQEIENGKKISLNTLKPTIVVTPQLSDYNQDHRSVAQAVFAATRPAPDDQKPLQNIIFGSESVPTANWWDSTSHQPNFFIPLQKHELEVKIEALKLYKSQVRYGAHPRSLESVQRLAYYRGIQAGVIAAEAFFTYRMILEEK